MWILTTRGMYSVVLEADRPGWVLVRARRRDDLERLMELVEPHVRRLPPVIATPERDYPFRIKLQGRVWADVAEALAQEIDYTNFKDEVERVQGRWRHDVYARVWTILRQLTPHEESQDSRMGARRREVGLF